MLGLKLNHVSKRGHWWVKTTFCWSELCQVSMLWRKIDIRRPFCVIMVFADGRVPNGRNLTNLFWARLWDRHTMDLLSLVCSACVTVIALLEKKSRKFRCLRFRDPAYVVHCKWVQLEHQAPFLEYILLGRPWSGWNVIVDKYTIIVLAIYFHYTNPITAFLSQIRNK